MKYFIIFFHLNDVVEIASFDEPDSRDRTARNIRLTLPTFVSTHWVTSLQTLDQAN